MFFLLGLAVVAVVAWLIIKDVPRPQRPGPNSFRSKPWDVA